MELDLWSENTRVFIDTCSFMDPACGVFLEKYLLPRLSRTSAILIVPVAVIDELRKLEKRKGKAAQAKQGLQQIDRLVERKIVVRAGEEGDSFPDNLFQTVFTRHRLKYRLVLITQDRSLARDILGLNHGASVERIVGIEAYRINRGSHIAKWYLNPRHQSGVSYRALNNGDDLPGPREAAQASHTTNRPGPTRQPPFAIKKVAAQLNETIVPISKVPSEGEAVFDKNGNTFRLLRSLGSGGEGVAYTTDQGLVCKVYHQGKLHQFVLDKLELMLSRRIDHPAVCWPVAVAHNHLGEPVGYLMPKANGRELKRTVFIKPLLKQHFPDWNRLNLVRLALSILDAITYLHSMNVLLGDINARNILVESDTRVYLVDCDSYQVEGYPCPVGMPPYLAPELHGKSLRSTIRTVENERFAIATLMFMLLHPGKPPYSHQGGEDPSKNVRTRHFPYPLGNQHGAGVPGGPWRFMWSHLPRYMKEEFHRVFVLDERLTIGDWNSLLTRYENDLVRGYVSDEAFPDGFKRLSEEQAKKHGAAWKNCAVCGTGFAAFQSHHTMCRNCVHSRHTSPHDHQSSKPAMKSKPNTRIRDTQISRPAQLTSHGQASSAVRTSQSVQPPQPVQTSPFDDFVKLIKNFLS